MKRYTETELEKIIRIGFSRIDQIIEKACADLDDIKATQLEINVICDSGFMSDMEIRHSAETQRLQREALNRYRFDNAMFGQLHGGIIGGLGGLLG